MRLQHMIYFSVWLINLNCLVLPCLADYAFPGAADVHQRQKDTDRRIHFTEFVTLPSETSPVSYTHLTLPTMAVV